MNVLSETLWVVKCEHNGDRQIRSDEHEKVVSHTDEKQFIYIPGSQAMQSGIGIGIIE